MDNQDVTYIIDFDALNNYIFGTTLERHHDTEITEIYEPDEDIQEDEEGHIVIKKSSGQNSLNIVSRTIREVKGSDDSGKYTIKYDTLKTFLSILNTDNLNPQAMSFTQKLIFNTLLSYGIIKAISNN